METGTIATQDWVLTLPSIKPPILGTNQEAPVKLVFKVANAVFRVPVAVSSTTPPSIRRLVKVSWTEVWADLAMAKRQVDLAVVELANAVTAAAAADILEVALRATTTSAAAADRTIRDYTKRMKAEWAWEMAEW